LPNRVLPGVNINVVQRKKPERRKRGKADRVSRFEMRRLTTLRESNEAENGEPQLQNKRGRLTTLSVSTRQRRRTSTPKYRGKILFLEDFRKWKENF